MPTKEQLTRKVEKLQAEIERLTAELTEIRQLTSAKDLNTDTLEGRILELILERPIPTEVPTCAVWRKPESIPTTEYKDRTVVYVLRSLDTNGKVIVWYANSTEYQPHFYRRVPKGTTVTLPNIMKAELEGRNIEVLGPLEDLFDYVENQQYKKEK